MDISEFLIIFIVIFIKIAILIVFIKIIIFFFKYPKDIKRLESKIEKIEKMLNKKSDFSD